MLNKHKKCIMDPMRIDNYNKFLYTLDNTNKQIKETLIEVSKVNKNTKNEIDNFIQKIDNSVNCNNILSSNFTGQTQNDIAMSHITINEPNNYDDYINKTCNVKIYKPFINTSHNSVKKEKAKKLEIKETINIEVEINNISDILKLIETYKYDECIKYNIDMKALHDIKEPLEELNNMVGMKNLKNNIVDQILYFVQQLHKNKNSSGEFLHTVIYGSPGTGKTEIAKIMGKIYSKIGVLSNGTFNKVTRSDLIAGYLGQTALKTKDVIKASLGGVLFIDEAYALGNSEKRDSFAKECIDTLCEALSDNKENLMVIIAGYEKELKESFFSFNQGLDSRFTWRFKTDDYTGEDLYEIFIKMVNDIGWEINTETTITADWFKKNKDYFQCFGRDIEILLSKTKIAHGRRVFCLPETDKRKITLRDLDKGFEIFLKNDDIKNKRDEKDFKKQLYNTLYS